ncbi:hypothetical protein [Amycolatopsis samaneae]|uniref:Uncharacterized protein n=1 Tax=Amycolatopsis samaneae TaxID=664691 RepID=A0ABW5GME0_9PSEU
MVAHEPMGRRPAYRFGKCFPLDADEEVHMSKLNQTNARPCA